MEIVERAVETVGTINAKCQLVLDEPLPITGPTKVRVIILLPEDSEYDEKEWLRSSNSNPAFEFLKDPEEDIYTLADGKPYNGQG